MMDLVRESLAAAGQARAQKELPRRCCASSPSGGDFASRFTGKAPPITPEMADS